MTFRLGEVAVLPLPLATERHIRNRGCKGKLRHTSEADALKHVDSLVASGKAEPGTLNTYPCRFCNYYHVGHP